MKTTDELCEIFGCTTSALAEINPADVPDALEKMYPEHYRWIEKREIAEAVREIRKQAFEEWAVAQQPFED